MECTSRAGSMCQRLLLICIVSQIFGALSDDKNIPQQGDKDQLRPTDEASQSQPHVINQDQPRPADQPVEKGGRPRSTKIEFSRVFFVINSQSNSHHIALATQTREAIVKDLRDLGVAKPKVFLTHENVDVPSLGAWTFFPTIWRLSWDHDEDVDWAVFLNEDSEVDLAVLELVLQGRRPKESVFIGHLLKDVKPVMIHSYDPPGLEFPHEATGFVMSARLLATVQEGLDKVVINGHTFPSFVSMDPHYDLALAIGSIRKRNKKIKFIHEERFCIKSNTGEEEACAVYPRKKASCNSSDSNTIDLAKKTLFAVKTCKKFHKTRLPVIRDTWHDAALNVLYFSEEADPEYGTVTLPGMTNTNRGHCQKAMSIIGHFNRHALSNGWKWLVIVDDDSMIGVSSMMDQLSCYDEDEALHLGDKYGYIVASGKYGYDYTGGGAGMVFNLAATLKTNGQGHGGKDQSSRSSSNFQGQGRDQSESSDQDDDHDEDHNQNIDHDQSHGEDSNEDNGQVKDQSHDQEADQGQCPCPKVDYADDLHLGECMARLKVPVVHCPRFHQGRPEDYHPKLLGSNRPVSFHKFDKTDPRLTYDTFFREDDQMLVDYKQSNARTYRQEL